ncbi:MAG: PDZ domain-containing protein [Acidobacteriota bacterium]
MRATRLEGRAALLAGLLAVALAWPAPIAAGERKRPSAPVASEETERFPALEALERELTRLVASAEPSVVAVIARSRLDELLAGLGEDIQIRDVARRIARRTGSGVVLDRKGHIVTIASVVSGASKIIIVPRSGDKQPARLLGLDSYSGLAVLAVDRPDDLEPITIAPVDDVNVGSIVVALGCAHADGPQYSVGTVSGTGFQQGPSRRGRFLRLNAYTAPGAAGGPVLDAKGYLVGLLFGARAPRRSVVRWDPRPDSPGEEEAELVQLRALKSLYSPGSAGGEVSYAVPAATVRDVTRQIIASGSVRRGWLGVTIESPEPGEVALTHVVAGGPAGNAGLRAGDRITAVDEQPLESAEALVETIAHLPPGSSVRLRILRDGETMTVPVVLGSRDDSPARRPPRWAPRLHRRPHLGVRIRTLDDGTRARWGVPHGLGLVVVSVQDDSRAQMAGLAEGDLLIEAEGIPMRVIGDLRMALIRQKPSRPMEIKILREGRPIVLSLPPPPDPPRPPAPGAHADRPSPDR